MMNLHCEYEKNQNRVGEDSAVLQVWLRGKGGAAASPT